MKYRYIYCYSNFCEAIVYDKVIWIYVYLSNMNEQLLNLVKNISFRL